MFELPSLWNIVVSTIVFIISAWRLVRYCDTHDIPKGMTRSLSVFILASFVSWGSGELVDWMQGRPPKSETAQEASKLLPPVSGTQP